jgi:hypothetical protein
VSVAGAAAGKTSSRQEQQQATTTPSVRSRGGWCGSASHGGQDT